MTDWEAFWIISQHLLSQGEQASVGSKCKYRTVVETSGEPPKVLRCAIGVLIPDDKYKQMFDDAILDPADLQRMGVIDPELDGEMLEELRNVHDWKPNWESEERLLEELNEIANRRWRVEVWKEGELVSWKEMAQ